MTPRALVEQAARIGLDALALTDHDTLDGVPEALEAGAALDVEVLPAAELTVAVGRAKVDVLAYLVDPEDRALGAMLEEMQAARLRRLDKMLARLDEVGYPVSEDEVRRYSDNHIIGRPHVAQALVDRGHASSLEDAFDRVIGAGKPGYVPKEKLDAAHAIDVVHGAGGVAVLAHPVLVGPWLEAIVEALVADGLDGIEAYYPQHDRHQVSRYEALARKHGLLVTGGSDYHGENKSDRQLGHVFEGRPAPYSCVEGLRGRAGG